jgi:hypothetical protein
MRIAPAVQNAPDSDLFFVHIVIHAEREALRKHSMITENLRMNARVEPNRLDIGIERLEEISTDTAALPFVEPETG